MTGHVKVGGAWRNVVQPYANANGAWRQVSQAWTRVGGNWQEWFAGPGIEDTAFYTNLGTGFNDRVNTLAIQSDGKILAGGFFTSLNGVTRNRLVRLNSNGTVDTAFSTNLGTGFNSSVNAIVIQSDGKILVGGSFSTLNGTTRNRLVRLNSNGTVDTAFYGNTSQASTSDHFHYNVNSLALQPDGKILIGGFGRIFYYQLISDQYGNTYYTAGYINGSGLVRINSDGTRDSAFSNNISPQGDFVYPTLTGFNNNVMSIAVQPDGKILLGGFFTSLNGTTRNRLVRLNSNGTVDTAFSTNLGTGFNSSVKSIATQSDGKILVGGFFTSLNGVGRIYLVRLNSNGTVDTAFSTNLGTSFNGPVETITIQSDGKILAGGTFNFFNNFDIRCLLRLNSDGTYDVIFNTNIRPAFSDTVFSIKVQPDGKLIVGGAFITFSPTVSNFTRYRLVRLKG